MTEEEAARKWCPWARVIMVNPQKNSWIVGNRMMEPTGEAPLNSLCFASACMAWRWGSMRGDGYCGLAGEP